MRILAIDGAGPVAVAACLANSDGTLSVLASERREGGGDADLLALRVDSCLRKARWAPSDPEVIAAAVGPGGFTSIRVAVAMARALSLATGVPVMAVTSFQAIAQRAAALGMGGPLRVVVPGGRGQWFVADSADGTKEMAALVLPALPGLQAGCTLVGAGGDGVREVVADALDVAGVAALLLASGVRPVPGPALVPLYLRGADARVGAGRSLLEQAGS